MAKKIKQIIWDNGKTNDELLTNKEKVVALGIQAAPGTEFTINNGSNIQIGMYGTYELDLMRIGGIVTSIKIISVPNSVPFSKRVLIDMVYEDGGADQ